ncbi:MAG TPA: hypothetical protein VFG42_16350 [Baekduia sp.]|uniref:hypothetical protein n=1 Tax=Baekduia sp. TaxID=2600305 RepID=UPI002D784A80|nr:hypothetical protein [Baekduia sp.]HET6508366.1 hypothetical protein [Baekduia sp.]
MRLTKRMAALAAAAGLGAGVTVGIAQAGGDDPPPLWQPTITDTPAPATTAEIAAYSVLAPILARGSGPDTTQVAAFGTHAQIGVDVDGSRVVDSTDAGPIWLIPVTDGLCLGLEDTTGGAIGAACEGSDDVITRGMTIGDGTTIYGIVPDGVTSVTVTPMGGSLTTATVSSGGIYTLPSGTATVSVDGPSGTAEFGVVG